MNITLFLSVTALACWSCCNSANMEQRIFASVTEAVEEIKTLSKRLTEYQRREESNKGCASREQLENLQMLLSKDECAEEDSNDCSPNAVCEDAIVHYRCQCLKGYSGDGFTCQVVCESPSQFIPSLGCITPVVEEMTWDAAKENCKDKQNGRLIQGLKSETDLSILKEHFQDILLYYVWVGIHKELWIDSGDPVTPSLWAEGEPDRRTGYGQGYGCLDLKASPAALYISGDDDGRPSLCQSSIPPPK